MDDVDFEMVMENSDSKARSLYREEAKYIEEIRKGILEVSGKEAPYDIFICYKETDENGERTLDSVLAQDVYDELTHRGFRVFFSRITLEDKLGVEYEPYIFAALNSAKIMLAFGTSYDFYNAVWVKNEWSRYLKLMAKDKSKHLIPCFKGIDAYDIPKEFNKFQSQDMGKIGAMQDLMRGIEKLLAPESKKETKTEAPVFYGMTGNALSFIKRGYMALEDGEWERADEFFEKALDMDPENGNAYLGKLLVDVKLISKELLLGFDGDFENNVNYKKIIRYGDNDLVQFFEKVNKRKADRKNIEICKRVEKRLDLTEDIEEIEGYIADLSSIKDSIEASKLLESSIEKRDGIKHQKVEKVKNSIECTSQVNQLLQLSKELKGIQVDEEISNLILLINEKINRIQKDTETLQEAYSLKELDTYDSINKGFELVKSINERVKVTGINYINDDPKEILSEFGRSVISKVIETKVDITDKQVSILKKYLGEIENVINSLDVPVLPIIVRLLPSKNPLRFPSGTKIRINVAQDDKDPTNKNILELEHGNNIKWGIVYAKKDIAYFNFSIWDYLMGGLIDRCSIPLEEQERKLMVVDLYLNNSFAKFGGKYNVYNFS